MANSTHVMIALAELVRDVTESYRSCTSADIWLTRNKYAMNRQNIWREQWRNFREHHH